MLWVSLDGDEAVGCSKNVRYSPDSDQIVSPPRNDVKGLGCVETLCWKCHGVVMLARGVVGAFFQVDYVLIAAISG